MGLSWVSDETSQPPQGPTRPAHPGRHAHRARHRLGAVGGLLAVLAGVAALASSHLTAGYLSGGTSRRGAFRRYWL